MTSPENLTKEELAARLEELVDEFPVNQQLLLLKHLIRGKVQEYLIELIKGLADDRQITLLKQLETIRAELGRKSVRKECQFRVDYETQDSKFKDYIQDLSTNGVFIKTAETLDVGQEVTMTLTLPGAEEEVKITGVVVRSEPDGYGVKFINMNPEGEDIIESCLQDLNET